MTPRSSLFALALLVTTLAHAAEPVTYPLMATVTLPSGAAGLFLPATVVAGDSQTLSQSLRLQDASGAERPFTVLMSSRSSEGGDSKTVNWEPMTAPEVAPGLTAGAWLVAESDVPLDGLRFTMDDYTRGPWIARVYAHGAATDPETGWTQVGEDQFLWALQGNSGGTSLRDTIRLPHKRGPYKVVVSGQQQPTVSTIEGIVYAGDHVDPATETVKVEGPVYTEEGDARYTIDLPGPRAVCGLSLQVAEPIFSRSVSVSTGDENGSSASFPIARAMIGEVRLDETEVRDLDLTTDRLILDVQGGRDEALTITGATVSSVGALLLTPNAGQPPQTLYIGGTEPDSASDVAIAADEIARVATRYAGPELVPVANPVYVARPTREHLDGAAEPLNLALWKWQRPVVADPGWTSIAIDGSVLLHARPNLSDLRLVDKDGNNLPFDLRDAPTEVEVPLGPMKRTENGSASEITLSLPPDTGNIRRIELDTDDTTFSRTVEILRDRGGFSETLRSVVWQGTGKPHRLVLDINDELGAGVMVRVQNGDNPKLSVTGVHAWTLGHELRANVPAGGARLVYGNRRAESPQFDLSLIRDSLGRVPMQPGTLGPESASGGVVMSFLDEGLVGVGMAALGVGLLALLIGAMRPIKPPADPAPASPPPAP